LKDTNLGFCRRDWLGESKERRGEVYVGVLEFLNCLMTLNNLHQLQADEASNQGRRRGYSWDDLPCYLLALSRKKKREKI
jgi:hypothetical protein